MKNSKEWQALEAHHSVIEKQSLKTLFERNPDRAKEFSLYQEGIYLDYSKNHIEQETVSLLEDFCNNKQLKKKIQDQIKGEIVNPSEERAALHTALRDLNNHFSVDQKVFQKVTEAREQALSLAEKLNSGELKNHENQVFKHLVCIGIGGSYLGPKLVFNALENFRNSQLSIHFLASVDPEAVKKIEKLELEFCLFFIASKSFSTLEALQNANHFKQALIRKGVSEDKIERFFIAATADEKKALDFGCKKEFILPIWDFVGGRFSLWSNIGFPLMVALGEKTFLDLLEGAHQQDRHFVENDFRQNMSVILGALAFWYQCFLQSPSRATIIYSHLLKALPAYLQQLEMESLGKSVNTQGQGIDYPSGAIIWGSEGPNSQHAFHQLLLQGTHFIPSDFIISRTSERNQNKQNILLSQCLAQSAAFAFGENSESPEKNIEGNQPSNTLVLDELNPHTLGSLLALYEHKVFVQSVLMDINAFDQWGVQLGKEISKDLLDMINNKQTDTEQLDTSTQALLKHILS